MAKFRDINISNSIAPSNCAETYYQLPQEIPRPLETEIFKTQKTSQKFLKNCLNWFPFALSFLQ